MKKIAVFSAKQFDRETFNDAVNRESAPLTLTFFEVSLNEESAALVQGFDAICAFVNDDLNQNVLEIIKEAGIKVIALRCAGFNNVDIHYAAEAGIQVYRVPSYSPYSVAEHTVALILTLNRKTHRAFNRVREGNFNLDGLIGFDLHQKCAGIVGTGKIGGALAKILLGFGMKVLAHDPYQNEELKAAGVEYVELNDLLPRCDILSLHCPLTPENRYLINAKAIQSMKDGVMIINTSRGALIDTRALIHGLKSKKIGCVGLDVYEEEASLFFKDMSQQIIQDDIFMRLTTFPNVLVTGHQAFLTNEALNAIAETSINNLLAGLHGGNNQNRVTP